MAARCSCSCCLEVWAALGASRELQEMAVSFFYDPGCRPTQFAGSLASVKPITAACW